MLQNESIQLDWDFRISLITDIVQVSLRALFHCILKTEADETLNDQSARSGERGKLRFLIKFTVSQVFKSSFPATKGNGTDLQANGTFY